jgi:hypothetical protein
MSDDHLQSAIIADPAFRLSLIVFAIAMSVFAATAFARLAEWHMPHARLLRVTSISSAGVATIAILAGLVASLF